MYFVMMSKKSPAFRLSPLCPNLLELQNIYYIYLYIHIYWCYLISSFFNLYLFIVLFQNDPPNVRERILVLDFAKLYLYLGPVVVVSHEATN